MNTTILISKMSKITSLIFYLLLFSCKEKQEILNDSENLIRIKTGDLFASNTRIELIDTTNNKILDLNFSDLNHFIIGYTKGDKYFGPKWHFIDNKLKSYIIYGENQKSLEVYEYDEFGKLVLIKKNGKVFFDERNEPPLPEN